MTYYNLKKDRKKIVSHYFFFCGKKVKKKAVLQSLMAQNGSMCPPSPPPSLLSRLWSSLRLQRSQRPAIPSAMMIQRTQSERRIVSNGNQNNIGCIKERPKQLQPSIRSSLKDNGRRAGRRPLAQELHSNKYENGQASPISSRPRTPKPAPRFSLNNSLTTMTASKPNNLRSKRHRPG